MDIDTVKVDHNILNKLIDYVGNHGEGEAGIWEDYYFKTIHSNEYTLQWSRGYQLTELDLIFREDPKETYKYEDRAKITRFYPSNYLHGDFYKALKMTREIFKNDICLYYDVIYS